VAVALACSLLRRPSGGFMKNRVWSASVVWEEQMRSGEGRVSRVLAGGVVWASLGAGLLATLIGCSTTVNASGESCPPDAGSSCEQANGKDDAAGGASDPGTAACATLEECCMEVGGELNEKCNSIATATNKAGQHDGPGCEMALDDFHQSGDCLDVTIADDAGSGSSSSSAGSSTSSSSSTSTPSSSTSSSSTSSGS
jgi:hypothetical protein